VLHSPCPKGTRYPRRPRPRHQAGPTHLRRPDKTSGTPPSLVERETSPVRTAKRRIQRPPSIVQKAWRRVVVETEMLVNPSGLSLNFAPNLSDLRGESLPCIPGNLFNLCNDFFMCGFRALFVQACTLGFLSHFDIWERRQHMRKSCISIPTTSV
jgi:hypothetical protein